MELRKKILINLSLEKLLSADATVTGMVRNIRQAARTSAKLVDKSIGINYIKSQICMVFSPDTIVLSNCFLLQFSTNTALQL